MRAVWADVGPDKGRTRSCLLSSLDDSFYCMISFEHGAAMLDSLSAKVHVHAEMTNSAYIHLATYLSLWYEPDASRWRS